MSNALVVAFDGLDKALIEEFGVEHILQQEFGSIGVSDGVYRRKTSELFTSFITGKTFRDHGVTEMKSWDHPWIERFEYRYGREFPFIKFLGVRHQLYKLLGIDQSLCSRDDYDTETLFEEIEDSRALFVPGYNPSTFMDHLGAFDDPLAMIETREYPYRKRTLFEELENDIVSPRRLLMAHFQYTDIYQHFYGDRDENFDRAKLRKLYTEVDDLAEEIKAAALDAGYDYVIFMSDHGLPEGNQHTPNAFYSCNRELFPDTSPHITDFHDRIRRSAEYDPVAETILPGSRDNPKNSRP